MKQIKLINKIAAVGTNRFDPKEYEVSTVCEDPDAIMVRSAALHDMQFPSSLKAIARCGAGVNNIPLDRCADEGIVVFNTPGANANGVKELTIAAMLLASRNIVGGINWANTLESDVEKSVEAGKSSYAGCELKGKTLGVIGLGAIGGLVANAAKNLGMTVYGCDPYITIDAAWGLSSSIRKATTYEEIFEICDYITLHVPSTKDTKNMINAGSIARMKKGVKIINLARADLACISDLKAAIEDGHVSCYVTDFPTAELINVPGVITIPHLGASTEESEDNCAVMAADELIEFLNYGNIKNSVNYPAISMPATDAHRIIILHKNIPNMISHVSSTLAKQNINIENMANRSKNEYAVTLIDTYTNVTDDVLGSMKDMEGIIRAYCVH